MLRFLAIVCVLFYMGSTVHAQPAGPALSIDVAADRHAINPYIYGMGYPDLELAREIKLPLARWGGDATTRYNWKVDSSNAGDDWFFIAGNNKSPIIPAASATAFIEQNRAAGGRTLLTIPIIDFINSAPTIDCSYPVSIFGPQQKVNPYVHPIVNGSQTDAGNGMTPDAKPILLNESQILRINMRNSPAWQRIWVNYITRKFGPASHGGIGVYELDNEPGGWGNTHRDVHPGPTGHDELVGRSIAYAAMIKSVDPTALVAGPGDFVMHYQGDGKPGDGKAEHAGMGQGNYYLQQMARYEKEHGVRILDYFDEHYYPLGQDGQTDDTVLECTRSLWDPTYREKNWVGKWMGPKDLIPKFHEWVDQYYPGTKISISEYSWGDSSSFINTLAQTEVLGIFGRERVDMACEWGAPKAADAGANAFRLYLNYDGHGSHYGDIWVQSTSEDQARLSIYAAQRQSDHALTLIVINKTHDNLQSSVSLAHFSAAASAKAYQYSAADIHSIVPLPDQKITLQGFSATFPSRSATLFVIPPK